MMQNLKLLFFFFLLPLFSTLFGNSASGQNPIYGIEINKDMISIRAGVQERRLRIEGGQLTSAGLFVNGRNVVAADSRELSVSFYKASPNEKPLGITAGEAQEITQQIGEANWTDIMETTGETGFFKQKTAWTDPLHLNSDTWSHVFDQANVIVSSPKQGVRRLNIRCWSAGSRLLKDVTVNIVYEIYEDHPAIRKWVEISNNSAQWLKIDSLTVNPIRIADTYNTPTDLTPAERGATTSLRSYQKADLTSGVIIGSEIPSALRTIQKSGASGYTSALFEWVLGPGETFVSEPVFVYAYTGQVTKTISAVSTPLDRTVERPFKKFLTEVVGLKNETTLASSVPMWCSWSNFGALISDNNMREMADIAAKAGFAAMQLDAGWAQSEDPARWGASSAIPDSLKFPQFAQTCRYITDKGLKLGLWTGPFRNPNIAPDVQAIPDAYVLPRIRREEGYAMSFTSPWKHYYAQSLLRLRDQYNITYFKQDLTSIKFGDIALTHESRTHKESLLRGLRGLLTTLGEINQSAPDVALQLTHEIYWGTPGVPCDLAALKYAHVYHIPPNDYSGSGPREQRFSRNWSHNVDSLQKKLVQGCYNARRRFFAHRGLPMHSLEYYGAATVNIKGSLTPELQHRQICSWFMGIPSVYAGDLASLTEENISTYRAGFDLLKRLHQTYQIYDDFQYSGVPAPTDTDWHWWGKLNEKGYGAVVVLRGDGGYASRRVNIPWVRPATRYKVALGFAKKTLGTYTGSDLIKGGLQLTLHKLGQEIILLEPAHP